MQLLKTGAFVRAARAAQLSTGYRIPSTSTAVTAAWSCRCMRSGSRRSSTQAAPAPAPLKATLPSGSDGDGDIDVGGRPLDAAAQSFRQQLLSQPHSQIVASNHASGANILGRPHLFDGRSNTPQSILSLVGRNLYAQPDHPLCITRRLIESCFPAPSYTHHSVPDPAVTTRQNFDILGFPADHPGRSPTDTYYLNQTNLLRTHTSAHQHAAFQDLLTSSASGYTITADVYRRDSIDRSHFPVFHQMEGAHVWALGSADSPEARREAVQARIQEIERGLASIPDPILDVEDQAPRPNAANPQQDIHDPAEVAAVAAHLKKSLENLVTRVFTAAQAASLDSAPREKLKARWIEAYFPFTAPSYELEVFWNGAWLELLGSGVVQQRILANAGLDSHIAWAWGIGIERIAMLLFNIPDIRLFWSTDPRFLSQFREGRITKFEPFSKYPACYKDVAFWLPTGSASASPVSLAATASGESGVAAAAGGDATKAAGTEQRPAAFHENDIMEIVRDVAGSLVEDVELTDEFVHPKTGRKSLCYRINYRSLERTLTNDEVNALHARVGEKLKSDKGVELR